MDQLMPSAESAEFERIELQQEGDSGATDTAAETGDYSNSNLKQSGCL